MFPYQRALLLLAATLPALRPAEGQVDWQPGLWVQVYSVEQGLARVPDMAPEARPTAAFRSPALDLQDGRGDFGGLQDRFVTLVSGRLTPPEAGDYTLRLISDDGSLLVLDGTLVIDHDGPHGAEPKDADLYLAARPYDLSIRHYEGGGAAALRLEWRRPGQTAFELVPSEVLSCQPGPAVTAEGPQPFTPRAPLPQRPELPVAGVSPTYELVTLRPDGFEPHVGGLAWLNDGSLLVGCFDPAGLVYRLDGVASGDRQQVTIRTFAHLPDPVYGLTTVGARVFALQAQQIVELVDANGDGVAEASKVVVRLPEPDRAAFFDGLASADGRLAAITGPAWLAGAERAFVTWYSLDGQQVGEPLGPVPAPSVIAADGPAGVLVADNLANRLYDGPGAGGAAALLARVPGPLDELSLNQPARLTGGPYDGQLVVGAGSHGGLYRIVTDTFEGRRQGVAIPLANGLEAPAHRLLALPDGRLVVGGAGDVLGLRPHGLQLLRPSGASAFEPVAVEAMSNGLTIRFSQPLASGEGWAPDAYRFTGLGPDGEAPLDLSVVTASVAPDRLAVFCELEQLPAGRLIAIELSEALLNEAGASLFARHLYYTLEAVPADRAGQVRTAPDGARPNTLTAAEVAAGWRLLFDGRTGAGWRGFRRRDFPTGRWAVADGCIKGFGGGGDLITEERFGNFELALEWRATRGANSGLMYRVTEEVSPSWHSGPEIQITDDRDLHSENFRSAGSCYEIYPPIGKTLRPAGQWNHFRLVHRGNDVEHWLNGVMICRYTIGSEDWRERVAKSKFRDLPKFATTVPGHLVLQDHGNEVWFRSIKLRELAD